MPLSLSRFCKAPILGGTGEKRREESGEEERRVRRRGEKSPEKRREESGEEERRVRRRGEKSPGKRREESGEEERRVRRRGEKSPEKRREESGEEENTAARPRTTLSRGTVQAPTLPGNPPVPLHGSSMKLSPPLQSHTKISSNFHEALLKSREASMEIP